MSSSFSFVLFTDWRQTARSIVLQNIIIKIKKNCLYLNILYLNSLFLNQNFFPDPHQNNSWGWATLSVLEMLLVSEYENKMTPIRLVF